MFSGIVEETGLVEALVEKTNLCHLKVRAKKVHVGAKAGDSIAVNGVCLTITKREKNVLTFDLMLETLRKTTLGDVSKGSRVNLERALKMSDRISGHFVSGHVDDIGIIRKVVTGTNYTEIQINFKAGVAKYIAYKGSICLDGISLTIGEVRKNYLSVYLIPFTLEVTNLGLKKKGDKINIETDILAKYIYEQRSHQSVSPYSAKNVKKKK